MASSKPCFLISSMQYPSTGLFSNGTMGFGMVQLSGRRRFPSPPAIITAFINKKYRLSSEMKMRY